MIDQIIHLIEQHDTIIIHRHERPDPDAVGSQLALKALIEATYQDKCVKATGYNEPYLQFLGTMDDVADVAYQSALVIVCDTANQPRIDDNRYAMGKNLIKIDHHPEIDCYGVLSYVNTSASSTSEMIYDLATMGAKKLVMTDRAAELLYAGIVGDTGRFLFSNTTPKTMAIVADLMTYDFCAQSLYSHLYETKREIAHLKGYLLQNLSISSEGVGYVKISRQTLKTFNVTSEETSALVGIFGDIKGVKIWAVFVEEASFIRVRLRSKKIAINKLAEKYGGGGHPLASGAKVTSFEEADALILELKKRCLQDL